MLALLHQHEDLAEALKGRPLATERHDVPLEEWHHPFAQHAGRRDLVDEHLGVARLRRDPPTTEDLSRELEKSTSALVLIQEKSWINVVSRSTRRVLLD